MSLILTENTHTIINKTLPAKVVTNTFFKSGVIAIIFIVFLILAKHYKLRVRETKLMYI